MADDNSLFIVFRGRLSPDSVDRLTVIHQELMRAATAMSEHGGDGETQRAGLIVDAATKLAEVIFTNKTQHGAGSGNGV